MTKLLWKVIYTYMMIMGIMVTQIENDSVRYYSGTYWVGTIMHKSTESNEGIYYRVAGFKMIIDDQGNIFETTFKTQIF